MPATFDYYYNRMKKMTLLRAYDKIGLDVSDIYDPDNILDSKRDKRKKNILIMRNWQILLIKSMEKIEEIKIQYIDEVDNECQDAAAGIDALFDRLEKYPDVGVPMYGPLINAVTRGARLRKLYLRSAPSGCGKSRSMIADVCQIGCNMIYDDYFGWIKNGTAQPTLYITQEIEEIQTMMIAFLSGVNEDHIN